MLGSFPNPPNEVRMGDFFAFRKMITPAVIQIFFWLGVIVCVIGGLGILSTASS